MTGPEEPGDCHRTFGLPLEAFAKEMPETTVCDATHVQPDDETEKRSNHSNR